MRDLGNPYETPTSAVKRDRRPEAKRNIWIPIIFTSLGLLFGVLNLIGYEGGSAEVLPGKIVSTAHARAASLGNWILSIAIAVASTVFGTVLMFVRR